MDVFGGLVAQSVEQCPFKALVESSSLSQPTTSLDRNEYTNAAGVKLRHATKLAPRNLGRLISTHHAVA